MTDVTGDTEVLRRILLGHGMPKERVTHAVSVIKGNQFARPAHETPFEAVAFIDQTIYANEDNPPYTTWGNKEVLELLQMIRDMLTPGENPYTTKGEP